MSIWNAVFFGLVQGLTEFFPVSSSAHLAALGNLFGIESGGFNFKLFTVFLHLGTIISLIIVLWNDLADMVYEVLLMVNARTNPRYRQKHYPNARLLMMLGVSTLPLFLLLLVNNYINRLYTNNIIMGVMLILSGTILFVADRFTGTKKLTNSMTMSDALIIGLCQLVAIIPGISRIATATTAGYSVGLKKDFALKYALLLSLPTSFGAAIIHIINASSGSFAWSDVPVCLVGMVTALLTGIFSLRVMLSLGEKAKFNGFSYYSWVAGVLFIILTMIF